jgi:hypothetical protein
MINDLFQQLVSEEVFKVQDNCLTRVINYVFIYVKGHHQEKTRRK